MTVLNGRIAAPAPLWFCPLLGFFLGYFVCSKANKNLGESYYLYTGTFFLLLLKFS